MRRLRMAIAQELRPDLPWNGPVTSDYAEAAMAEALRRADRVIEKLRPRVEAPVHQPGGPATPA